MPLFHVSKRYLGESVVMEPRVPTAGTALGEDRAVPRISVAESVPQCLIGITGLKCPKVAYAYRARRPEGIERDLPARLVPDWEHSGEIWLTEATEFRFVYALAVSFNILRDDYPSFRRVSFDPAVEEFCRCGRRGPKHTEDETWTCPGCHLTFSPDAA